jgi:hypothetical protein
MEGEVAEFQRSSLRARLKDPIETNLFLNSTPTLFGDDYHTCHRQAQMLMKVAEN